MFLADFQPNEKNIDEFLEQLMALKEDLKVKDENNELPFINKAIIKNKNRKGEILAKAKGQKKSL